ncbi:MAG: hypothetical protein PVJ67_04505 [Candidatus Pacearchaeota archaeon]
MIEYETRVNGRFVSVMQIINRDTLTMEEGIFPYEVSAVGFDIRNKPYAFNFTVFYDSNNGEKKLEAIAAEEVSKRLKRREKRYKRK